MFKSLNLIIFSLSLLSLCLICDNAHAFCGFYATSSKTTAKNNSSEVALMRYGTKTVLSMRNNYKGPAEDFAIVIPVPEALRKKDVHTLPHNTFDRLHQFTAPRLVEYWEHDPCSSNSRGHGKTLVRRGGEISERGRMPVVKASFVVGEYTIEILSAEESNGLETWLTTHGYRLPKGASKILASYIAQGMYFFVAKVDPKKVKFDTSGNALLSPLQFGYTSTEFSLPVRLGLLNASGPQDLIVYILSPERNHFVPSNYKSAFYPTNLVIGDKEAKNYDAFNEALFEDFQRKYPKAFAIEHFWGTGRCDPCPLGGSLDASDVSTLGLKKALEPDLSLDLPAIEFTYPGIREEGHAGLARHISDAQTRDHIQLLGCYDDHRPLGGHTAYLHVSLEISPAGKVERVEMSKRSFHNAEIRRCIEKQLETWTIPASKAKKRSLIEFGIGFYAPAPRRVSPYTKSMWYVTRLHGRYTSKDISEDIRFKRSDLAFEGGQGPPRGPNAALLPFQRTDYSRQFQSRHVLLHDWEKPLTCKYPDRGRWGLSVDMTSKKKATAVGSESSSGKFKLGKDVRKQLDDFYKQQEEAREKTR
jgi:hypothetical protein